MFTHSTLNTITEPKHLCFMLKGDLLNWRVGKTIHCWSSKQESLTEKMLQVMQDWAMIPAFIHTTQPIKWVYCYGINQPVTSAWGRRIAYTWSDFTQLWQNIEFTFPSSIITQPRTGWYSDGMRSVFILLLILSYSCVMWCCCSSNHLCVFVWGKLREPSLVLDLESSVLSDIWECPHSQFVLVVKCSNCLINISILTKHILYNRTLEFVLAYEPVPPAMQKPVASEVKSLSEVCHTPRLKWKRAGRLTGCLWHSLRFPVTTPHSVRKSM